MKNKMHLKAILGLGIALVALAGMAGVVSADPARPETFHGVAKIDGHPAPHGMTIEARDSGGRLLGSTQTTGTAYFMSFSAPEDGDPAPPNPAIHFWIDSDGEGPSPRYEAGNNPYTNWAPEGVNSWDITGSIAPTAIRVATFVAKASARSVKLTWTTGSELDNLGFNVYKAAGRAGRPGTPLNGALIPSKSPGSMLGATYTFVDPDVQAGTTYRYWIEDMNTAGRGTMHGPVTATVPGNANAAPTNVSVTPSSASSRPWAWTEFTITWSDPDGVADIRFAEVLINDRARGTSGVWLRYFPANGKLLLRNPDTNKWIRVRDGRSQNRYALVEVANIAQRGNDLQITYRLKAKGTFLGEWNLFLRVLDKQGGRDGWDDMGDWAVAR